MELIDKEKMDISKVSLAKVADEYLKHVKALDKVNQMIETAEEVTQDVGNSLKNAASGMAGLVTRNIVTNFVKKIVSSKNSKKPVR